jgi:hypothetical protein
MKRVIIICEGETEREFCQKMLAAHFIRYDIYVQAPLIKKSMGGIVKWQVLKKQIETHLTEPDVLVTMLIDYYGVQSKHQFPDWEAVTKTLDKNDVVALAEKAMQADIDPTLCHRFLPYLQLHEFEGLLFNDINVFHAQIPPKDLKGLAELEQTFQDYPDNPEMINENKTTAPSERLRRIIDGYNKVVYGHYLAEAIGLDNIRRKSPRFDAWLTKIEKYLTSF